MAVCPAAGDDSGCSGESRGRLHALGAASGQRHWTVDVAPDTRSSPAVADGPVYLGCGDGLSAVTTGGGYTRRTTFESDRDDPPYAKSSPAVAGGRVLVGASGGRLRAIGAGESE